MLYIMFSLLIISFFGILFCGRNLRRNREVAIFRKAILELCYQQSIKNPHEWCAIREVYEKMPDYDATMYSFKPLELDKWLTPDQLNILKQNL